MGHFRYPSSGGAFNFLPPLDAATAVGGWGLRKLRSAYTGPAIRLCKSGDTTGVDIGFSVGHFDIAGAQAYLGGTTGGLIKTIYDQVGTFDFAQATIAKQPSLVFNSSANGKALIRGVAGSLMTAADSASYKTNNIHLIGAWRVPPNEPLVNTERRYLMGYPTATNSGNEANRWALTNSGGPWQFLAQLNGDVNENTEGVGAAYRKMLYPYSYSTQSRVLSAGPSDTLWDDRTGATITYPNAVGLHLFNSPALDGTGSSDGTGTDTGGIDFAEAMLFSSTQASEAVLMANIGNYYGVAEPAPSFTDLGYTWTARYFGGYGAEGFFTFEVHNSVNWYRQGALDTYSLARAASGSNASSLMRMEVRKYDNWNATTRSELNTSGTHSVDATMQFSCAFMVPTGMDIGSGTWNTIFQHHYVDDGSTTVATAWSIDVANNTLKIYEDRGGSGGRDALVYTSGTIVRDVWHDLFVEVKVSSGTADVLKIFIDGSSVVNDAGDLFTHNGSGAGYQKLGIYRDASISAVGIMYYANIELTNKATTDITARIASPVAHPTP